MPQAGSCKICAHGRIEDINTALAAGRPLKAIARQFSVSATTLTRHHKHCLPQVPQTERASPPQPRPGVTPELLTRIIAANEAIQRSGTPTQTAVAMRQFAQAITDAFAAS